MQQSYFSHDIYTRENLKIKKLISTHGMQGYGVFWAVVEFLHNNNNRLSMDELGIVAHDLGVDIKIVESVVKDFKFFVIRKSVISSNRVAQNIKLRLEKSEIARKKANKRWVSVSNDAVALQQQCCGNAIKEKESKEKENKEKENKEKESKEKENKEKENKEKENKEKESKEKESKENESNVEETKENKSQETEEPQSKGNEQGKGLSKNTDDSIDNSVLNNKPTPKHDTDPGDNSASNNWSTSKHDIITQNKSALNDVLSLKENPSTSSSSHIFNNFYGSANNVHLTESQYKSLCNTYGQDIVDTVISELSYKIAIGKEQAYNAEMPNMHLARLDRYAMQKIASTTGTASRAKGSGTKSTTPAGVAKREGLGREIQADKQEEKCECVPPPPKFFEAGERLRRMVNKNTL